MSPPLSERLTWLVWVRLDSGQSMKTRLLSIRPAGLAPIVRSMLISGSPPRKLGDTTVAGAKEILVVVSKTTCGAGGVGTNAKPEAVLVES